MNGDKPTLSQFKQQISGLFGQPLTLAASEAAEDFYRNWDTIFDGVTHDSIRTNVDVLALARQFKQYGKYHIWKGLGMLLVVTGLVLVFFLWQLATVVVVAGVCIYLLGDYVRVAEGRKFSLNLIDGIKRNPSDTGMAALCAHYIAGTIELASDNARAHWPQHPSDVLTGNTSFIQTS